MTPRSAASASTLRVSPDAEFASHASYVDAFTVTGLEPPPARACAELALRGVQAGHGLFAKAVWGALLGLTIAPLGSPGTVAGWDVSRDEEDRCDLEVDGSRMQGRMVFTTTASSLTWTTALTYRHPVARPTWALLGPIHRALTPAILLDLSRGAFCRDD